MLPRIEDKNDKQITPVYAIIKLAMLINSVKSDGLSFLGFPSGFRISGEHIKAVIQLFQEAACSTFRDFFVQIGEEFV